MKEKLQRWVIQSPALMNLAKRVWKSTWVNRNPLFQKAILAKAQWTHARVDHRLPAITLETTLTCNARCLMCVHSEREMAGEMSLPLFEKLIQEIAGWGVSAVGLSIYGEPFADRHWLKRIEIVRKAGLNYGFFSNGSLLREEVLARMFEWGGWDSVNFSVNGFSPEVYEKIMPPLKRESVYQKLEMFLNLKTRLGAPKPWVTVSLVQQAANRHELSAFQRYWQNRPGVDRVCLADCGDWIGELKGKEDLEFSPGRRGFAPHSWPAPCPLLWNSLFVYADGRVSPCCEDAALRQLIVGDTTQTSLREVWQGPALSRLRDLHRHNQRTQEPICAQCGINWWWF